MFSQSRQVPTSNCTYSTSFIPRHTSGFAGWNPQQGIANVLLQNELLNRIQSICAADFYNQRPVQYPVNAGLDYNHSSPFHTQAVGGHSIDQSPLAQALLQMFAQPYGGLNTPASQANTCGPVSCIDNDTEVCFECDCPGLTARDLDICIVQNEIHIRLVTGTTPKSNGNRASGRCVPLFNLPLPSFCDPSKCSAKVEHGRLAITCPRTADYVKNITRVKVC